MNMILAILISRTNLHNIILGQGQLRQPPLLKLGEELPRFDSRSAGRAPQSLKQAIVVLSIRLLLRFTRSTKRDGT